MSTAYHCCVLHRIMTGMQQIRVIMTGVEEECFHRPNQLIAPVSKFFKVTLGDPLYPSLRETLDQHFLMLMLLFSVYPD